MNENMNENNDFQLTLDPFGTNAAAAAAAVAEAPEEGEAAAAQKEAPSAAALAEAQLSDAEKKAIEDFAKKLDVTDTPPSSSTAPARSRRSPTSPTPRSATSAPRTSARSATWSRISLVS